MQAIGHVSVTGHFTITKSRRNGVDYWGSPSLDIRHVVLMLLGCDCDECLSIGHSSGISDQQSKEKEMKKI